MINFINQATSKLFLFSSQQFFNLRPRVFAIAQVSPTFFGPSRALIHSTNNPHLSADTLIRALHGKVNVQQLLKQVTKDKFEISCVRSGGPGGQNVNKINSKAVLRLNLKESDWLPDSVRDKLCIQEKNRITKEGHLVVTSEKTRNQEENILDGIEKVRQMLERAAWEPEPPSAESLEKKKKQRELNNEKRLAKKRKESQKRRQSKGDLY